MDATSIESSFEDSLISFSKDIYREIDGTVSSCVSPYSVVSALLMLMVGTRGTSKSQIKSAILRNDWNDQVIYQHYQTLSGKVFNTTGNELNIATKLFVKNGLTVTRDVRNVAKTSFSADIGYQDFTKPISSARVMNRYVANRTNNKITDLIQSRWLNTNTIMVLVNAIYFKGTWETQFDPKNTQKEDFFLTEQNKIKVDMMTMKHYVRYYNGRSFSAIALPYIGNQLEMMIVLPRNIDGLNNLKNTFSTLIANVIDSGLRNTSLIVKIPKFTIESVTDLKILLPKLGITDIFISRIADFSNLVQQTQSEIYVSEARHKVVIEVNEIGTEAAAGTAIVVTQRSSLPQFAADHPFLFYIRHRQTSSILFVGHYNPQ